MAFLITLNVAGLLVAGFMGVVIHNMNKSRTAHDGELRLVDRER